MCSGLNARLAHSSRPNCVTTITCSRPPRRWPVFCVSISYVTSQPEGQKLMEDEMVCDFLPPTTVTVLQTHSIHMHSHTHAVLNLALLREVWEPLPSLNKLPWYARLSRKIWRCVFCFFLKLLHSRRCFRFVNLSDYGSSQDYVGDLLLV